MKRMSIGTMIGLTFGLTQGMHAQAPALELPAVSILSITLTNNSSQPLYYCTCVVDKNNKITGGMFKGNVALNSSAVIDTLQRKIEKFKEKKWKTLLLVSYQNIFQDLKGEDKLTKLGKYAQILLPDTTYSGPVEAVATDKSGKNKVPDVMLDTSSLVRS
jgi:hypothetical protein